MSTTPQRYGLKIDGDLISIIPHKEGKYILFTDHEADKARAVGELKKEYEIKYQTMRYHVKLCWPMKEDPFNQYDCNTVDVGHADKIVVIECPEAVEQFATQQATIARLTEQAKLNELITELSAEPPQWQVELTFTQEDQWLAKVKRQFGHSQFYQFRSASLFAALSVAFNMAKQANPTPTHETI